MLANKKTLSKKSKHLLIFVCALITYLIGFFVLDLFSIQYIALADIIMGFIVAVYFIRMIILTTSKEEKIYVVILFALFEFFLLTSILRSSFNYNDRNYFWYLSYLPMLFIPTVWFNFNIMKVATNKKVRIALAAITNIIATVLLVLVLTNNIHEWVFKFQTEASYTRLFPYYIIMAYIYCLIVFVIVAFLVRVIREKQIKKAIVPIIFIALTITYSVLYMFISFPIDVLNTMNIAYTMLGTGITYSLFLEGFINNSGEYREFFDKCFVPISLQTSEATISNEAYKNVINFDNYSVSDYKTNKQQVTYLNDISRIKELEKEIILENEKLSNMNALLAKENELKAEEALLEERKRINEYFESRINKSLEDIKAIEDTLPLLVTTENKEDIKVKLNKIKKIIGDSKRKASLVAYKQKGINVPVAALKSLYSELGYDYKFDKLSVQFTFQDMEELSYELSITSYEIIVSLLEKVFVGNKDVWVVFSYADTLQVKITLFDEKYDDTLVKSVLKNIKYTLVNDVESSELTFKVTKGDR